MKPMFFVFNPGPISINSYLLERLRKLDNEMMLPPAIQDPIAQDDCKNDDQDQQREAKENFRKFINGKGKKNGKIKFRGMR